ncbi:conserved hypothetical protein [Uncinocarpus reesii 1704]|uniref:AB hydrolase-1 domain-containing protein n=1 Tax=Uncinocarpus reesii (strain UAMH 1704) TaxID=336963 RepID=C4JSK9_UNCRE|nr:uncharacterized protein UREG_05448 [Uncinocarpus reesii 1704]EEP80606.1 conserved hypothetical protein [Uncinocarpus reesii 1704]
MDSSGEMSATSMVSIGTHRLAMSVTGPDRCSVTDPIVIVLTGAGDVASSYVALARLVSRFSRILLYDRSGLGASDAGKPGHPRPSAVAAVAELHMLLTNAGILPPLLLVGHSFGAIIAREYLHLYPGAVAGMVLCDPASERQSDYFKIPDPNIDAVMGNLNYAQVTGLRTDTVLTREEWRTRAADILRGMSNWEAEAACFKETCEMLAAKKQCTDQALGSKPLSVIRANSARDYERIYKKGVEVGNGTEEQRRAFRHLLDKWDDIDHMMKVEQLQLSSNSRLVHLLDCGHHVHLVQPDVLAEEIKWPRDFTHDEDHGGEKGEGPECCAKSCDAHTPAIQVTVGPWMEELTESE